MLHVPRVLPGVALRVVAAVAFGMCEGGGVERRLPFARAEARTHEISALVEEILVEIGAAGEILIVVLLLHQQRHVGGGVVVVDILERARNRLHLDDVAREVAVFHISLPVRLHLVRLRLRHLNGLEGALRVEVAEALVVSLGHDGHAVVGNHAIVFLAPKRPYRQVSLRFGLADHRAHEGTYHFRHGQRVERVRGAVGVPGGEGGVERAVFGFRQIAVGVAVRAVYVGNVVRLDKGMVEAGVEICLFHVRAFHLDAVEIAAPHVLGFLPRGLEIPARQFRLHVAARAVDGGGGEGYFHLQLLAFLEVERHEHPLSLLCRGERQGGDARHGAAELHLEIYVLFHPHVAAHMTREARGAFPVYLAGFHVRVILLLAPRRSVLQVDEQGGGVCFVERVAVVCHVRRGGEFGRYIVLREFHRVIARACPLAALAERAAVVLAAGASRYGHHQHVAEVGAARAVEVRLAKSPYPRVGVDVFRAILPAHRARHRACLNQSEGQAGTGKRVSGCGSADKGIDVVDGFVRRLLREERCCRKREQQRGEKLFHGMRFGIM